MHSAARNQKNSRAHGPAEQQGGRHETAGGRRERRVRGEGRGARGERGRGRGEAESRQRWREIEREPQQIAERRKRRVSGDSTESTTTARQSERQSEGQTDGAHASRWKLRAGGGVRCDGGAAENGSGCGT